ncbi:WhiB family transcriptional regulator [Actinotignum sp. GS-2025b]|uniref:WhiB family transcriptional regulator n=1 Tax=Actinotignum sp. GS-2025b TaxID=3427275 RepID=UPI003F47BF86
MRRINPGLRVAGSGGLTPQDAQDAMLDIFDLGYDKADSASLHWRESALCAQTDPDVFFPEKGGSTAPATSICHECPVREECLEYALQHDIRHGIWGGMSDNDRRRLSRQRRRVGEA